MKTMRKSGILIVLSLSLASTARGADKVYVANPTPPTDGLVGANYTAAYAVNQVQFWHDFRADVIDKEMAAASKYYGIKTLRVYLHNINFDKEKDVFLGNIEKFLKICAKYGIKPGFCFFDDCHRHADIYLDKPTKPVKGYHNGRWAACPQDRDRDPKNIEKFKPYIQEVIRPFRTDKRVLWWEIFNEPKIRKGNFSDNLRGEGYKWAKEVKPVQPVLSCWNDNEATDIVNAHNYRWYWGTKHGSPVSLAESEACGLTAWKPGLTTLLSFPSEC